MISTLVWTLPRPPESRYRGGFPRYFEPNLLQILGYPNRILHPFGGMAEYGTRVDLDPLVEPDIVADAHDLPFEDETFDCVILDPPYSEAEAQELYAAPPPRPAAYTREAVRVLREGGWLVVYGDREPARPARCNHAVRIVVVLRPHHRPRIAMVFQKRKPGMPFYGTELGELEQEDGAELAEPAEVAPMPVTPDRVAATAPATPDRGAAPRPADRSHA